MIKELLLKTFIPVSRIFDNEDDIFIFSRNVRKSSASENYFKKAKSKKIKESLSIITSDISCNDINVRFTRVPLTP